MPGARYDFDADQNWPWVEAIAIDGFDLSVASGGYAALQVRSEPGGELLLDAPLRSENADATHDCLLATSVDLSGDLPVTNLFLFVKEATMRGLAMGPLEEGPTRLHYDLMIRPAGVWSRVALYGDCRVRQGVSL